MCSLRPLPECLPDLSRTWPGNGFTPRAHLSDDSGGGGPVASWRELREAHRPLPGLSRLRNGVPVGRRVRKAGGGRAGANREVLQAAPFHLNHLIDAPAGRIHFQAKFAISGAGIQAKAATNAPGVVHPTGSFTWAVPATIPLDFCPRIRRAQWLPSCLSFRAKRGISHCRCFRARFLASLGMTGSLALRSAFCLLKADG